MNKPWKLLWVLFQIGILLFIFGILWIHLPDKTIYQPWVSGILTALTGIFYIPRLLKQIIKW